MGKLGLFMSKHKPQLEGELVGTGGRDRGRESLFPPPLLLSCTLVAIALMAGYYLMVLLAIVLYSSVPGPSWK